MGRKKTLNTALTLTHPHLLLVGGVGEGDVAELKEPPAKLQVAHAPSPTGQGGGGGGGGEGGGGCGGGFLPEEPAAEHQVVDVASVLCHHFGCHCTQQKKKKKEMFSLIKNESWGFEDDQILS